VKKTVVLIFCFIGLWAEATHAATFDHATIGYGHDFGNGNGVDTIRLGLQKDWNRKWFTEGAWYLSGYWEAELSRWNSDSGRYGISHLWELDFRPVFRLYRKTGPDDIQPYAEAGIGAAFLSETELDDKNFSSAFQFCSDIGFGMLFGRQRRFELGYRLFHISNGGIKNPNPGVNFNVVRLGYRF
jgi:lipid A 3-O-deacylase